MVFNCFLWFVIGRIFPLTDSIHIGTCTPPLEAMKLNSEVQSVQEINSGTIISLLFLFCCSVVWSDLARLHNRVKWEKLFPALQDIYRLIEFKLFWHYLYPSSWLSPYDEMRPGSFSPLLVYGLLVRCRLLTLAYNFLFSFSITWTVYFECRPPFCVPRWNIRHCSWFFFSTGWQFKFAMLPHFSRNSGTWYTRAAKSNVESKM